MSVSSVRYFGEVDFVSCPVKWVQFTPASYAALLLSSALMQEIEKHPALYERWTELEREVLLKGSWDGIAFSVTAQQDKAKETY